MNKTWSLPSDSLLSKTNNTGTCKVSTVKDKSLGYLWEVQRGNADSYLMYKLAIVTVMLYNTLFQTQCVTAVSIYLSLIYLWIVRVTVF